MFPFRRETLPSIVINTATDGGQRKFVPLSQNSFTSLVYLVLRVTVVVTVASMTSLKFPGSAAQAFDQIGINENGYDRVLIDPRIGFFIGQMRAQSALSSSRLGASLGTGTYQLVETIPIFLSNPNALNPGETAFREKNPTALTQAFVQFSSNAVTNLCTPGSATVTISAASCDVIQEHNPNQKTLPWMLPVWSQQLIPVNAATTLLRIPIMTDRYLQALIINGESSSGWQSDVLNNIRLMSDVRQYIGPQMTPWEDAGRMEELIFGGSVFAPNPAGNFAGAASQVKPTVVGFDFQRHGQLSTIIEPNETGLRLEVDCQPSATGAATNIRVTTLELVRDLNKYTGPGGTERRLCNPAPLPWTVGRGSSAA